jgi:hypothetical protein
MESRAGGKAKDSKLRPSCLCCFLKMRLHIHARLGGIGKQSNRLSVQHDGTTNFIFDLDQFWKRSGPTADTRQFAIPQKRRGPEGPFRYHQRR